MIIAYLIMGGICLFYLLLAALALWAAVRGLVRWLRGRGEESGVPEEPVPAVDRHEVRKALDTAFVDGGLVRRRLDRMVAENLSELRALPRELAKYYVAEADR